MALAIIHNGMNANKNSKPAIKKSLNEPPRSRAARYQNDFLSYLTPMQSIEEFF
jgi:hypothetical protein